MKSKFSIDYVSDSAYENLTVEISFEGQILCQINQDKGKENMEIEFFHEQYLDNDAYKFKFLLKDLFSVINEAILGLE